MGKVSKCKVGKFWIVKVVYPNGETTKSDYMPHKEAVALVKSEKQYMKMFASL